MEQLRRAANYLGTTGSIEQSAAVYESSPIGQREQPMFLNSALVLNTDLRPQRLLRRIKQIECQMGREPAPRWQARQIDIDILTWSGPEVRQANLEIPHKMLTGRLFALLPLAELAPEMQLAGRAIDWYIQHLRGQHVKKVAKKLI